MIVFEYGSHSATLAPFSTLSPSLTINIDAYGKLLLNNSLPSLSTTASFPLRLNTTTRPALFLIVLTPDSLIVPDTGTSIK